MLIKKLILIIVSIIQITQIFSQSIKNVTNNYTLSNKLASKIVVPKQQDWFSTDKSKSLYAASGLIALGFYTYKDHGFMNRKAIHKERNRYIPHFKNKLDDYIQYIPYISIYALDAFGIKSKYSFKRKTSSLAIATIMNLVLIQSLKRIIGEERPDKSTNNSFPSGHTANAFMAAHILHKEYGDRSPYYSIAGYSLATTTGIFRQLNNRHWISDVLVGAGIGIALTELAYYLNGVYFGNEGINKHVSRHCSLKKNKYSFINAKIGISTLTNKFNNEGLSSKRGYSLGVEGAYFFNKYLGIGCETKLQSFPLKFNNSYLDEYFSDYKASLKSFGCRTILFGPFIQYVLGNNIIGAKFLFGGAKGSQIEIDLIRKNTLNKEDKIILIKIEPKALSEAYATGIYYKRILSNTLTIGIYSDYSATILKFKGKSLDGIENDIITYNSNKEIDIDFNSYSIGLSIDIKF